jgi:hypothetical protein
MLGPTLIASRSREPTRRARFTSEHPRVCPLSVLCRDARRRPRRAAQVGTHCVRTMFSSGGGAVGKMSSRNVIRQRGARPPSRDPRRWVAPCRIGGPVCFRTWWAIRTATIEDDASRSPRRSNGTRREQRFRGPTVRRVLPASTAPLTNLAGLRGRPSSREADRVPTTGDQSQSLPTGSVVVTDFDCGVGRMSGNGLLLIVLVLLGVGVSLRGERWPRSSVSRAS